jgi:cytochrome c biogenesis protein CcdA
MGIYIAASPILFPIVHSLCTTKYQAYIRKKEKLTAKQLKSVAKSVLYFLNISISFTFASLCHESMTRFLQCCKAQRELKSVLRSTFPSYM